MNKVFTIAVILCLFCTLSVQSFSVLYKWTVSINSTNPQGAPYLTKLGDDKVVFAFFQQKTDSEPLKLVVQTYTLSSGKLKSNCQVDKFFNPAPLNYSLYNLKLNEYADSNIILSYVIYDQQKRPNLKVHIIDVISCSSRDQTIDVEPSGIEESVEFHYSILPHKEEIDIFVSSPSFCKEGFCKLSFSGTSNPVKKPFDTAALKKFWELVPINSKNLTDGFYYLTINDDVSGSSKLKVTKLNADGKVLKTIETDIPFEGRKSYSNAYGNLGFCSQKTDGNVLNCLLLDSSLNERLAVKNVRTRKEILPTYTVLNTEDNQLLITNTFHSVYYVFPIRNEYKVTEVRKAEADGKLGESFELFKCEFEPFINKHYQGFIDDKDRAYCTAITHVKHIDDDTTYYTASIDFKCFKIE